MAPKLRCHHPEKAVGMSVQWPASMFGVAWAKKEHGAAWTTTIYAGKVVAFLPIGSDSGKKVTRKPLWKLQFQGDSNLYSQSWDGLQKWLSEDDLRTLMCKTIAPRSV